VLDSLLYTFADEFVPAAACATFATASDGDGVIVNNCARNVDYNVYKNNSERLQRREVGVSMSGKHELKIACPHQHLFSSYEAGAAPSSEAAKHGFLSAVCITATTTPIPSHQQQYMHHLVSRSCSFSHRTLSTTVWTYWNMMYLLFCAISSHATHQLSWLNLTGAWQVTGLWWQVFRFLI
jgi:hypothetical protein